MTFFTMIYKFYYKNLTLKEYFQMIEQLNRVYIR